MLRFVLHIILLLAFGAAGALAQMPVDSAGTISLVTCYPGSDVYELYGHTMLRVRYAGSDVVFNYGVFDFDSPNFIYRFVKGETDYKVVGYDARYLLHGYERRKVVEQQLNLTPTQVAQVAQALYINALPENATYRYNYIYDNCATRPRDIIEQAVPLQYGAMRDTLTFRQEMRRYNANYAWQQLGIDLVLGTGIDHQLDYREQMFVPMVLMQAFAEATVERDGKREPLVTKTIILNPGSDQGDILPPTAAWASPMAVAVVLLIVCLVFSWLDASRGRVTRWLDSAVFGLQAVAGLLVFFLIFISTHAATSPNINGLWLHPLALLPATIIWIKKWKKVLYFYHFANFAVIIVLLALWPVLPQGGNAAMFPLMASIAARSGSYILVYRKCAKTAK